MLLRLAYLGVTNAFAILRLLPMSDRDKNVEILALRHQLAMLERQLGATKVRFDASGRALLAALLHQLPPDVLRDLRLLVRPDTVLRWHRDLLARRHAHVSRPKRPVRPRTVRSVRVLVHAWRGKPKLGIPTPAWRTAGAREFQHLGCFVADATTTDLIDIFGLPFWDSVLPSTVPAGVLGTWGPNPQIRRRTPQISTSRTGHWVGVLLPGRPIWADTARESLHRRQWAAGG